MNKTSYLLALAAALAAASSGAAARDASEFFGRVEVTGGAGPEVMSAQPVTAASRSGAASAVQPVYLHVRPGHELSWARHCAVYDACGVPVLFVKESWYRRVHLGEAQDGREQRYLQLMRATRDERESRRSEEE